MIYAILINLIARWIKKQEKFLIKNGGRLSGLNYQDALNLGVKRPWLVRVFYIDEIKLPLIVKLLHNLTKCQIPLKIKGLPCGYGIFLQKNHQNMRALIAHELVHVRQFESFKNTQDFIKTYLRECKAKGYRGNRFEVEAYQEDSKF